MATSIYAWNRINGFVIDTEGLCGSYNNTHVYRANSSATFVGIPRILIRLSNALEGPANDMGRGLCKTPLFAQSRRHTQILILKILNVFLPAAPAP